jgi:hypothetical protein
MTKSNQMHKLLCSYFTWHAVAQLVEALRYKPEGRGFDSKWKFFQPLTEMSIRNISWGVRAAGS